MMMHLKVDDEKGINWDKRARLLVVLSMGTGMTKEETLSKIKDNDEFKKLVSERWDKVAKKLKKK